MKIFRDKINFFFSLVELVFRSWWWVLNWNIFPFITWSILFFSFSRKKCFAYTNHWMKIKFWVFHLSHSIQRKWRENLFLKGLKVEFFFCKAQVKKYNFSLKERKKEEKYWYGRWNFVDFLYQLLIWFKDIKRKIFI